MNDATTEDQLEQAATGETWLASDEEPAQGDANGRKPTQDDARPGDIADGEPSATEELPAAEDEAVKPDTKDADENDVVDTTLARTNADVIPPNSGRRRRVLTILGAVLGVGLLLTLAGAAYATYDFKRDHEDKILPGAVIAGVDVGGMTKAEAMDAVSEVIRPDLTRTVTVRFGDKEWEVTPEELGARSTARAAVRTALAESQAASWLDLAGMRFMDDDLDVDESVSIRYKKKGAEAYITGLREEIDAEARDAELDYSTGWVKFVKERVGHKLIVDDSTKALMASLRGGDETANLAVKEIKPEVTSDSFDQVLLLRQNDFTVYMYTDGKISHQWPVAVGTGGYPTPTGEFTVELKRYMPTWINPDPEGWGASMPAMIPPGPSNPLGLRAINWTAAGIRFHGTSATSSIGTAASHGCVRMYNEDVIELYDLVEVGSPIISTWG